MAAYSIRDEYQYPEFDKAGIDNYIQNRLLSQIEWYDKKSGDYQKKYKRISILTVTLNGLIPIIILLADYGLVIKLLIAIISSGTAVLTSIQILNSYKDLWIQYRSNSSVLQSTLHRFYTGSGEFANKEEAERFSLLVELSEDCMTSEFQQWRAAHSTENKPQDTPQAAVPPVAPVNFTN